MKDKKAPGIAGVFLSAVAAGMCIALGGSAFLSIENKVVGAIAFTVGLFVICSYGFHLFTGKVCYVLDNDGRYAAMLPVIWIGNVVGAWCTAFLEHQTRVGAAMTERAVGMVEVKLGDNLLSVFVLAIFCNILIYIAVEGFARHQHEIGRYVSLFFGVSIFILCGFEHCVANMYYISMANAWSAKALVFILVNTLGNAVGGLLLPVIRKGIARL
ncbi:MAG: formate/nitrite transporter family protein [Oscillospiraceae bacterium]|nr:formate/nitrite transporter family protein [Oscillospiraceae bacterium]